MAYTILKSDGTILTTISDSTRDTTTSLSLAGPNFVGYGLHLNENLVYLLENFASNGAPSASNLQGQLWFDKYNQMLKVFTDQGYVPVAGVTNSGTEPSLGKNGDMWYNTVSEQMYVYDTNNTAGFKLVGPGYTRSQGVSGAIPVTVEDGSISGIYHNIVKLQFGNVTYATFSQDIPFLPSPAIPGFTYINPGITFNSNIAQPIINADIIGTLTGDVHGNLTGNVVATTLSGSLTGDVHGNLTGNVVATTLSGSLTGDVVATNIYSNNFSSGNVSVTGGSATGLTGITAGTVESTTSKTTTGQATNFSSSNVLVTSGNLTGLTQVATTTGQATNFSSSNVLVTGGSATGLTQLNATTIAATNLSVANIVVTNGQLTNITSGTFGTLQVTNFSSANIAVTGGSATGLTTLSSGTAQIASLSASNAIILSGNISNVTGANVTLFASNLQNSVATTKSASDKTTSVATTAFVHSVIPTGIIVMWNSTAVSIPGGWQLCDGSNSTPDLRDRFIVGAGSTYSPAATGGSASVTLDATAMPVHAHSQSGTLTTNSAGGHTHGLTDPGHLHSDRASGYASNGQGGGGDPSQKLSNLLSTTTGSATTGISVNSAVDHTHTLTLSGATATAGGSGGTTQPHENRPPYYALCYIQKMY